ncbi:hypothetical protein JXL83_05510 [candidate division WOR-3 bacterium]|nr:hypothetical protein [candidate division WOR-3 bacterium]
MALDIIQKIKESEEKAEKIVSEAQVKAGKTVLDAEDDIKNELKKIQSTYKKRIEESLAVSESESRKIILEMTKKSRDEIEQINVLAEKNSKKAVERVLEETGF